MEQVRHSLAQPDSGTAGPPDGQARRAVVGFGRGGRSGPETGAGVCVCTCVFSLHEPVFVPNGIFSTPSVGADSSS